VTFGTHVVPVLVWARPVKDVVVCDFFVRVEVKPALATFAFRTAIPGNTEGLKAAAWKLDEVLLEWIDPEYVLYFIIVELAVRAVCADHEFAVTSIKPRFETIIGELFIVEITQHGFLACHLHGEVMMRARPEFIFFLVASSTDFTTHKSCWNLNLS